MTSARTAAAIERIVGIQRNGSSARTAKNPYELLARVELLRDLAPGFGRGLMAGERVFPGSGHGDAGAARVANPGSLVADD